MYNKKHSLKDNKESAFYRKLSFYMYEYIFVGKRPTI